MFLIFFQYSGMRQGRGTDNKHKQTLMNPSIKQYVVRGWGLMKVREFGNNGV